MRLVRDDVDLDVGQDKPSLRSVAVLGVPLPMMALVLVPTVSFAFWLATISANVATVMKNQEASYSQRDALRDLLLRDDRIDRLKERVTSLEGESEHTYGRKR